MAGDWVKIENVTPDKPEVFAVADILGIDADAVVGKLIRIWIWADQQTTDGRVSRTCHALRVTHSLIDRLTGVTGFAGALQDVGWLANDNGVFTFPNFDRHNGETSKRRALATKRQQKKRSRTCHAPSVTEALPEKRREESVLPKGSTHTRDASTTEMAAVADAWNMLGDPFPKCARVSAKRRTALKSRLADDWWRANWGAGIERVRGSPFLRGETGGTWVATFEWFIKPDSLTKIMEGTYDDRPRTAAGGQSRRETPGEARERANNAAFDEFLSDGDVQQRTVRVVDVSARRIEAHGGVHSDGVEGVACSAGDVPF